MQKKIGRVSKLRTLKLDAHPLVRFTLDDTNCLIATHSLNFLADVDEDMRIVVLGDYNSRNQFVVRDYKVIGKSKIVVEYEKSMYPHRKIN